MKIFLPPLFLVLFALVLVFLSTFNLINDSLNYSLMIVAVLWAVYTLVFEIIGLFNKSASITNKLNLYRKISLSVLILPGVILFAISIFKAVYFWISSLTSDSRYNLPLVLPFLIPHIIFIAISLLLVAILIYKVIKYFSNKKESHLL